MILKLAAQNWQLGSRIYQGKPQYTWITTININVFLLEIRHDKAMIASANQMKSAV